MELVKFLLIKCEKLQGKLKDQKRDIEIAMKKVNKFVEVIQKIKDYIGNLGDVINKAKLFNNHLANNPISGAKVIIVLMDFA